MTLALLNLMVACRVAPATDTADTGPADTADTGSTDTADTGSTDTGTPPSTLSPGFLGALDRRRGCANLQVAAANVDDTVAVYVRVGGLLDQAYDAGGPLTWDWAFPVVGDAMAPPEVTVEQGEHLTSVFCNDVIENPPVIARTWTMVEGTLSITVTPTGTRTDWGEMPARADVSIAYGAFVPSDDPSATPVEGGDILISTGVGWLPG
jgi:hypothetical protein